MGRLEVSSDNRITEERSAIPGSCSDKSRSPGRIARVGREVANSVTSTRGKMMEDRLMNVREVAEFLGLAPGTVYHLLSQRRLPCIRLSPRCVRFQKSAIRRFVESLAEETEVMSRHSR